MPLTIYIIYNQQQGLILEKYFCSTNNQILQIINSEDIYTLPYSFAIKHHSKLNTNINYFSCPTDNLLTFGIQQYDSEKKK